MSYVSTIDGPAIEALRRQGLSYSEIGQQLGTTKDAARGVHRRWSRSSVVDAGLREPSAVSGDGRRDAARDLLDQAPVYPQGPSDAPRARARAGASSSRFVKTEIELSRAAIAKATRAEIRLKYSLLADEELNEVLAQRLADFDRSIQDGIIPSLSMRMVADE